MCNTHNLLAYCCELFEYEKIPFSLCANLYSFEIAKYSTFAIRMLMYSIAANMILRGEY